MSPARHNKSNKIAEPWGGGGWFSDCDYNLNQWYALFGIVTQSLRWSFSWKMNGIPGIPSSSQRKFPDSGIVCTFGKTVSDRLHLFPSRHVNCFYSTWKNSKMETPAFQFSYYGIISKWTLNSIKSLVDSFIFQSFQKVSIKLSKLFTVKWPLSLTLVGHWNVHVQMCRVLSSFLDSYFT